MRIGVFSDTHGSLVNLPRALALAGELDAFVHLGDFGSDAERIALSIPVPYDAVRGNCDFSSPLPKERVVTFEDASVLLIHGDAFRSTYEMSDLAERRGCAAVLFGHTHTPLLAAQGSILILNPGSLSRPRYCSAPSFAVLLVNGRDVNAKMISLD